MSRRHCVDADFSAGFCPWRRRGLSLVAAGAALISTPAVAATALPAFDQFDYYAGLFGLLVGALVVATVLESALAVLFNWRIYRTIFNGRAWKTVFMVGGAWIIVTALDYNIVEKILNQVSGNEVTLVATPAANTNAPAATTAPASTNTAATTTTPAAPGAQPAVVQAVVPVEPDRSRFGLALLSVMFLAGGSAGVHNVLQRFGYRSPLQDPPETKLDATEAWVSVSVIRNNGVGPIEVRIEEVEPDPNKTYGGPVASVLDDTPVLLRAWRTLFAQPMRHPPYGGRLVNTTKVYRITIVGRKKSAFHQTVETSDLVYEGRFASRAVVDFTRTF